MHNLASITPLGGSKPRQDHWGNITLTEVTDRAIASVTARSGTDVSAWTLFGTLPGPGQWRAGAPYDLIWTSPDQWFVTASYDAHPDLATELKKALGDTASVTEQTDGWVCFDLTGADVVDLIERLCPVPARRMTAGMATRSMVEHIGCLVVRFDGGFTLMAPRSYAASLYHALHAAAVAVG